MPCMKQCLFIMGFMSVFALCNTCHVGGEYKRNNGTSHNSEIYGPWNDFESGTGEAKVKSVLSLVHTGNIVQVSMDVLMYDV